MESKLTLYVKTGCPFCERTIEKLQDLGLSWQEKNIADAGVADELVARGGKRQTPYLIDSERGVEMYESEDIMQYLEENYGEDSAQSD